MPDHQPALHNCGPGPNAVYQTAPSGTAVLLDLFAEIRTLQALPERVRTPFAPTPATYDEDLPYPNAIETAPATPQVIMPVLAEVFAHLPHDQPCGRRLVLRTPMRGEDRSVSPSHGPPTLTHDDAASGIRQMARHLRKLGYLVAPPALVTWVPRATFRGSPFEHTAVGQPLPWLRITGTEYESHEPYAEWIRLAWLLCAFSHTAPPLVLFSREPSLRFWRGDGGLSVRWLGAQERDL